MLVNASECTAGDTRIDARDVEVLSRRAKGRLKPTSDLLICDGYAITLCDSLAA
jgi:hypothetical protein